MEKRMKKVILILMICTVANFGLAQPAQAIKQFSDQFLKLYKVDKKSEDKSDFAEAVLKAKCYTCHQGKKKKHHNRYGQELEKLLDKKKDKKNTEKIVEALKKVAEMHINPKDKNSPTYGKLIQAGKLPGGPLADAKKEPPAEDSQGKGSNKRN